MALKAYALTTVARYKTFAGITVATDDTLIEIFINQVTEFVEKYCGRRFKKTTYTATKLDSDGGEVLHVPQYPIISTSTFTLYSRDTIENEDDWTTVDSEDYYIDYDAGLIYRIGGNKWIRGRQYYKVDYTAGYDFDNTTTFLSDTQAGDLEYAVWQLIDEGIDYKSGEESVKSESIADYSVTYGSTVEGNMSMKSVLDNYKSEGIIGGGSPLLY